MVEPMVQPLSVMDELGDTGLRRYSGYVREEFLRQLSGRVGALIFREMRDNDAVVGGMMFVIEQFLRNVKWSLEPADDTPESKRWAEFVDQCLSDMERTWPEVVTEILTFLTFGWDLQELVYKYRYGENGSKYEDGLIGWKKLPTRSQETLMRWQFDIHGTPTGFYQIPFVGAGERFIPASKYVLFRTTTARDNPEGRSILRNAYVSWYYKKRISEIEVVGIDRDLAGMPVMRIPSELMAEDATESQRIIYQRLQTIVRNVKRNIDEGIILPSDTDEQGHPLYDLKLLSTAGNRQFDTDKIISRYDLRIAQSVLADFILLGHKGVGSFALSHDKTDMFAVALGGFLTLIADPMNTHAIPELMKLNGVPNKHWPKLTHSDLEDQSLEEVGGFVRDVVGAGAIQPDKNLEQHLRKLARFPEKGELLQNPEAPADKDPTTEMLARLRQLGRDNKRRSE